MRERVRVVIKAFPGGDPELAKARSYGADVVLLDSASPGSGRVFDWSLAEGRPSGHRILLAGGLNPDNVAEAIDRVRPWGVDVATGVESSPGVKDPRAGPRLHQRGAAQPRPRTTRAATTDPSTG